LHGYIPCRSIYTHLVLTPCLIAMALTTLILQKMKTILIAAMAVLFTFACTTLMAQTQKPKGISIPFEASRFDTSQRKAMFMDDKGMKIMMISPSVTRNTTPVTLKGLNFTNGTIEFDAKPTEGDVDDEISINFHQKDVFNLKACICAYKPMKRRNALMLYSTHLTFMVLTCGIL
jgi:hypothetical protein